MSAVEVAAGGSSVVRRGVQWGAGRLVRLRALAAPSPRDAAADPAWAAALADAPQAVPRLQRPRETRQLRLVAALVIAAHAVVLFVIVRQARLAPPPGNEIVVELVRQMPDEPRRATSEDKRREVAQQAQPTEQPKPPPPQKPQARKQTPPKPAAKPKAAQREEPKPAEPAPLDMPPIALPGAGAGGDGGDAIAYPRLVLSQVAKAKKAGRYMGVPGYAGVRFRVAEDGSLESVKLASSSGDANLDIEAEAMIRRAAPFPPPPPGGRRDYGITLVFKPQP